MVSSLSNSISSTRWLVNVPSCQLNELASPSTRISIFFSWMLCTSGLTTQIHNVIMTHFFDKSSVVNPDPELFVSDPARMKADKDIRSRFYIEYRYMVQWHFMWFTFSLFDWWVGSESGTRKSRINHSRFTTLDKWCLGKSRIYNGPTRSWDGFGLKAATAVLWSRFILGRLRLQLVKMAAPAPAPAL